MTQTTAAVLTSTSHSASPTLTAALEYAARGWEVFPVYEIGPNGACACRLGAACEDAGKHPRNAHGLSEATTDPAQIQRWWRQWPAANLAVRTGATSDVVAVDKDPRNGGDDTLAELEHTHGRLPETAVSLTGGGGEHYLFTYPADVEIKSVSGALGPGMDVKAKGGYIIVPPSGHVSGGRYEWDFRSDPADVPLAPLPAWVLARLNGAVSSAGISAGNRAPDVDVRVTNPAPPVAEVIPEGKRHTALVSLAGSMRRRNMSEAEILAALLVTNRDRCQPAMSEREVRDIAGSVAKYAPEDVPGSNRPPPNP